MLTNTPIEDSDNFMIRTVPALSSNRRAYIIIHVNARSHRVNVYDVTVSTTWTAEPMPMHN